MSLDTAPVLEKLKTFKEHDDLVALSNAIDLAATATAGANKAPERKQAWGLWLQVLADIDAKFNPAFDPKDVPSLSVAPPPETGLPAGVDPASIKDPVLAKKYQAEIAQNQKKAAQYSLQNKLRKLERRAVTLARAYLTEAYTHSFEDQQEALGLLNVKPLTPAQKAELAEHIRYGKTP